MVNTLSDRHDRKVVRVRDQCLCGCFYVNYMKLMPGCEFIVIMIKCYVSKEMHDIHICLSLKYNANIANLHENIKHIFKQLASCRTIISNIVSSTDMCASFQIA